MSKLSFVTADFRCRLRCDQCSYVKPDGQRCRNRVCIGYPLCWIHTKKEFSLRVKDSTIEGAGKGLFATTGFYQDQWICPYVGENVTHGCLDARYPGDVTAPYATQYENPLAFNAGDFVDSACVRGVGAMANGIFLPDGTSAGVEHHNAQIETREGGVLWLRATEDIGPHDEIFLHYGDQYVLENNYSTRRSRLPDTRPC